jgi:hypothetical protein
MVNNSTYTNKKKNHLLTSNHVSQENTKKYDVGNQDPGLWQAQQCGECKTIKEILTSPSWLCVLLRQYRYKQTIKQIHFHPKRSHTVDNIKMDNSIESVADLEGGVRGVRPP